MSGGEVRGRPERLKRGKRGGAGTITLPSAKPRGRPFQPGNPGRPAGSKNKTTQALEQLAEGQAEQLFEKVFAQALAGCVASQRMVLDRIWPPRKGRPVNVVMPPINASHDVFPAIASIWTAIREGRLTPDEASTLSVVMDRSIQAIAIHDITKRLDALEEARAKRDDGNKDNPTAT
jgi:hypothetical protein